MNQAPAQRTPGASFAASCAGILLLLAGGCGNNSRSSKSPEAELGQATPIAGQVRLTRQAMVNAGIAAGRAEPALIEITLESPGEVRPNGDRTVQVRPRYAGVVSELDKKLGDRVRTGDRLALIQSNESLSDYPILARQEGVVIARSAAEGQAVEPSDLLYTITDLSSVWVMMAVYPQDLGSIRMGQSVRITAASGPALSGLGVISYVGPDAEADARVSQARIILDNPRHAWQPGLFVQVAATVQRVSARVAVPTDAIVRTDHGPAVFAAEDTTFTLRPVTIGSSNGRLTEVVTGLEPETTVVIRGAFVLKAELGRAEVEHEE